MTLGPGVWVWVAILVTVWVLPPDGQRKQDGWKETRIVCRPIRVGR